MTGDEYIECIRDGREVWIYGERVKDVTTHPAFRNTARMIARLYDALHDPARATCSPCRPTPATAASRTRSSAARTPSTTCSADRDAIADWARMTYGWMGRSPDYKASFLGTLGANSEFYAPYEDNAKRWYRESQEKVLVLEPRDRQPAGRPQPAARTRSATSTCTSRRRPTPG